jgi:hypothetical protein
MVKSKCVFAACGREATLDPSFRFVHQPDASLWVLPLRRSPVVFYDAYHAFVASRKALYV